MANWHKANTPPTPRTVLSAPPPARRSPWALMPKKLRAANPAKPLRLVGRLTASNKNKPTVKRFEQPITGPTDPRWVLAVRTAEQLQGDVLAPERREKLNKLGKLMGLSPFAINLVVAIVQDQARRGYEPHDCPTASEPQLRMIALPDQSRRRTRALRTALAVATLLAVELVVIQWWLLS